MFLFISCIIGITSALLGWLFLSVLHHSPNLKNYIANKYFADDDEFMSIILLIMPGPTGFFWYIVIPLAILIYLIVLFGKVVGSYINKFEIKEK